MEHIIRILECVRTAQSIEEKENLIEEHRGNRLFCQVLFFLLDTGSSTGIDKKSLQKVIMVSAHTKVYTWIGCMEYLKVHQQGRDTDIAVIQDFLAKQTADYVDRYSEMVTKTLELGITEEMVKRIFLEF